MTPTVSVLMPVHNAADTLERALKSILLFDKHVSVEVVACDDASTDATPALLDFYSDRIKVVTHTKNQGLAPSLNSAAEVATGRYFIELDSDDYLAPCALCHLSKALDQHPENGFAYGQTQYHGNSSYKHTPQAYSDGLFNAGFDSLYAFMYRREAWDAGCRYRSTVEIDGKVITIQDWDMALQLIYNMRYRPLVLRDVLILHYTYKHGSLTDFTQAHNPEVVRAFRERWPIVSTQRI